MSVRPGRSIACGAYGVVCDAAKATNLSWEMELPSKKHKDIRMSYCSKERRNGIPRTATIVAVLCFMPLHSLSLLKFHEMVLQHFRISRL